MPFEQFHKYSTDIVRTAVFGKDKEGQLKKILKFPANNLVSFPLFLLNSYYYSLVIQYTVCK